MRDKLGPTLKKCGRKMRFEQCESDNHQYLIFLIFWLSAHLAPQDKSLWKNSNLHRIPMKLMFTLVGTPK